MAALFKTPKMEKPPAPPTIDDARANLDIRKQLAARKGRSGNIIAGANPMAPSAPTGVATKILLGQ